jgi:hypothetical protein
MAVVVSKRIKGLYLGMVVAIIGFVLSSPWWVTVAENHSLTIFTQPLQTVHSGSTTSIQVVARRALNLDPANQVIAPIFRIEGSIADTSIFIWNIGLLGCIYLLLNKRLLLPIWFGVTVALMNQPRFQMLFLPLFATPLLIDVLGPALYERANAIPDVITSKHLFNIILICLILSSSVIGGILVVSSNSYSPDSIDDDIVEGMEWTNNNTPSDSTFVTIGGRGEWLPYFADRTIVFSPWGTEWTGQQAVYMQRLGALSRCPTARCVSTQLSQTNTTPDYIFITKDTYYVGLIPRQGQGPSRTAMDISGKYTLVYENRNVLIYRIN